MRPVVRRIDDTIEGASLVVGNRVVTPVARRRGWVLGTPNGMFFSLGTRSHGVVVESEGDARLVRMRNWTGYITLGLACVAVLLAARRPRERRGT